MDKVFAFLAQYAKAITALIVTTLTLVFGHYGLKLDPEWLGLLTIVLNGFFVYLVPNKPTQ